MSYKTVKQVIDILLENGYTIKSQKGSHIKLEKNGYIVIVPNHGKKGVEKGTYHSILRQAGLTILINLKTYLYEKSNCSS